MWNELASYKNHFLQWQLPQYKSERINKIVKKEFKLAQDNRDYCNFTDEVECTHSAYFKDRTALAYGWFALPKLMREMASDLPDLRWRAINTLADFIINPLHAQRAITEMEIVRKVQNVLLRYRFKYLAPPVKFEILRLLRIFTIISGYYNGAAQIAESLPLLKSFYDLIQKKESQQHEVSKILRNLSEKPKVLLRLDEWETPLELLSEIFLQDVCRPHYPTPLWLHLSHFLEIVPEKGITYGLFELCHKRIKGKLWEYHVLNMKCFALMLRCEEGQLRFDNIDGIKILHDILIDDEARLSTYEFVVFALLSGLHSKRALWRCHEFPDYPSLLMNLAKHTTNKQLQLYCFKALRQMGEMPCVKRYMQVNIQRQLKKLPCLDGVNEDVLGDLLIWLKTEKYHTAEDSD